MTTRREQEMVQVTQSIGARIQLLREGRRWTIETAATRAGLTAAVWEHFEQGLEVTTSDYQAILELFGFTPASMAFIERSIAQGVTPQ